MSDVPSNPEEALHVLQQAPDSACACSRCADMCRNRACWPTPAEAQALLAAGYADRLMADYWNGGGGEDGLEDIYLLSPAEVGSEGVCAPICPGGRCTFLTQENRCELHVAGLKPSEGRKTVACQDRDTDPAMHQLVAFTWNSPAAQQLVMDWHGRPKT